MNVSFVSLGCDKNRVNTEQMMALCLQAGITVQEDCPGSDVVVINTCGFIDSAKSEAIDTILSAAQLKEELRINRRFRTGTLSKERQALLFTVCEHRAGNEAIVDFSGRKNAGPAVVGLETEEQREVTFAAIEINEERRIFGSFRNPAPQKRRYGTRTRSASSTRHRNGLSDPHA